MKHHYLHAAYALLLILALSLYVGCSSYQTQSTVSNYRYGTQALDMQWQSGNPSRIYIGDDLALLVRLSNKGTADITGGELFLSGYDPAYLDLQIEPSPTFDLKGKDQYDPNGDFSEVYTLRAQNVKGPSSVGQFPQTIQLTACYQYQTQATATVCIDSDPYNKLTRAKACTSTSVSPGGQGHPVVVSSIEPIISRDSVRFNIRLTNSGNGVVYNPRVSSETCAAGPTFEDLNRVIVSKVTLGGRALDCSPQNPIWLNNGAASLTCVCDGTDCVDPNVPAYQTLLEVNLRYGYRNTISTQVTIVNSN